MNREGPIDVVMGADLAVAEMHHLNPLDALDARSQGLTDLYPSLFARGDPRGDFAETMENPGSGSAILIDEMTLHHCGRTHTR